MSDEKCKLDLDSPSYPPKDSEYFDCGCSNCLKTIQEKLQRLQIRSYADPQPHRKH